MSNISLKFKHINENATKITDKLLKNKDFLRYIKILSDTPLEHDIPLNDLQSNMIDSRDSDGHIVLKEFDEDVLTETKIKIFFHPWQPQNFTDYVYSDIYIMDIIVPSNNLILEGSGVWRTFAIAEIVAQEIDNQRVAGLGKCEIINYNEQKVNNAPYTGLRLTIKVNNAARS